MQLVKIPLVSASLDIMLVNETTPCFAYLNNMTMMVLPLNHVQSNNDWRDLDTVTSLLGSREIVTRTDNTR